MKVIRILTGYVVAASKSLCKKTEQKCRSIFRKHSISINDTERIRNSSLPASREISLLLCISCATMEIIQVNAGLQV